MRTSPAALHIVALALAAGVCVLPLETGCSSSSSAGSGESEGGLEAGDDGTVSDGSSDGPGPEAGPDDGTCTPPDGTYTVKYTATTDAGKSCASHVVMETYPPSPDAGALITADGGLEPGCSCKNKTLSCTEAGAGSIVVTLTTTLNATGWTGTMITRFPEKDGGVLTCKQTISATKN
jgi:hypothetical protein